MPVRTSIAKWGGGPQGRTRDDVPRQWGVRRPVLVQLPLRGGHRHEPRGAYRSRSRGVLLDGPRLHPRPSGPRAAPGRDRRPSTPGAGRRRARDHAQSSSQPRATSPESTPTSSSATPSQPSPAARSRRPSPGWRSRCRRISSRTRASLPAPASPRPASPGWRGLHRPRIEFTDCAAVAQLARASACHAEGRGFESHQPLRW